LARKTVERNIAYDDQKNKYYANLDFGKDENGKQIKKAITFDKITDARKALREHEAKRDKGLVVLPKQTTLREWLSFWLEDIITPNGAETTVYAYRNIIDNHIDPYMGDEQLQKLLPKKIQQYYSFLNSKKELSNNTVRKHHDLLNSALKVAVKQDVILSNPIDKVNAPKTSKSEVSFYRTEDLRRLLQLVEDTRLELVVKLAGCLGMRREEILGLKWDKVDFERNIIIVCRARTAAGKSTVEKETKNETSYRNLYFTEDLKYTLLKELNKQKENALIFKTDYMNTGYVAVDEMGKPYRPNYISYLFTKFVEDNNLPYITLHGLRHTFASVANSLGVPQFEISKALGHSTPAITGKIYTHVFDITHEATITKVNEAVETTLKSKLKEK